LIVIFSLSLGFGRSWCTFSVMLLPSICHLIGWHMEISRPPFKRPHSLIVCQRSVIAPFALAEGVVCGGVPGLTIVNACSLYVLVDENLLKNQSRLIIFESSQVNGWDGNDSHHPPCGP
jgi:hypothetical protein